MTYIRRISSKILISILATVILPLLIFGHLAYSQNKTILQKEITSKLVAVADSKVRIIEDFADERRKEITGFAFSPTIINALIEYGDAAHTWGYQSRMYQVIDNKYADLLRRYLNTFNYHDLFLISLKGEIVFSASREDDFKTNVLTGPYKDSGLGHVFRDSLSQMESSISDLAYYAPSRDYGIFIAVPVIDRGQLLGVLAIQLKNEVLYENINDISGLGNTGEIVLGKKYQDRVMVVVPLRHDPDAMFKREIKGVNGLPIQNALKGAMGNGILFDYRAKEVLSVWRYIPSFRWGMVVKMDVDEVFAPIEKQTKITLLIIAGWILLILLLAVLISRAISRPINELSDTARKIAAGKFDTRVEIEGDDEIASLGTSFNHMADRVEVTLKNLKKSNDELEQFAYVASHDLKAPLRAIENLSDWIAEDLDEVMDDDTRENMNLLKGRVVRMEKLLDGLLQYSRIGRIKSSIEDVDVGQMVHDIVDLLPKKEGMVYQIDPDMPTIRTEKPALDLVFRNLIGNALKHNDKKDGLIKINAGTSGSCHVFVVEDNGPGIPEKFHDRIFVMFQTLKPRDEVEGSGMGLALVKKTIENFGGDIQVVSDGSGQGTIFRFTWKEGHLDSDADNGE